MKVNKYALVLGASGDIGEACAKALAADGWSLYCHYHQHQERVQTCVHALQTAYPAQTFLTIQADLTQEADVRALSEQLFQVDALVFASGATVYKLFVETSEADLDYLWHVMLKSPMQLCQQLQTKLSRSGQGRIIFIGSVYGLHGSPMEVAYSALKGGQQSFVNAYSKEVATLGITCNVVAPGAVATQMNAEWTEEEMAQLVAEIPLQRLAQPVEVAAVVQFLASEGAQYLTGATIPVTGGWYV